MPNHYHLLIQTIEPNLGRIMRHVNGVYTQRFNKIKKIDGPLFRGRYKSILVDSGEYLLELSRYIHRNPIQTENKQDRLVKELSDYQYSSYRSYLNFAITPKWLNKELTLSKFKSDEDQIRRYRLFVEKEENQGLEEFFTKKNKEIILGSTSFKEKVVIQKLIDQKTKQDLVKKEINDKITSQQIIEAVAKVFGVKVVTIVNINNGRKIVNLPRDVAVYLCQQYKDITLKEIANIFNFKSPKSTSNALSKTRKKLNVGNKEVLYYLTEVENEIGWWKT